MIERYISFSADAGTFLVILDRVLEVRRLNEDGTEPALSAAAAAVAGISDAATNEGNVPIVAPFGPGREHLVVLEGSRRALGLAVIEVTGVVDIDSKAVHRPPDGQAHDLISGVVMVGRSPAYIVDVSRLERMASLS